MFWCVREGEEWRKGGEDGAAEEEGKEEGAEEAEELWRVASRGKYHEIWL